MELSKIDPLESTTYGEIFGQGGCPLLSKIGLTNFTYNSVMEITTKVVARAGLSALPFVVNRLWVRGWIRLPFAFGIDNGGN